MTKRIPPTHADFTQEITNGFTESARVPFSAEAIVRHPQRASRWPSKQSMAATRRHILLEGNAGHYPQARNDPIVIDVGRARASLPVRQRFYNAILRSIPVARPSAGG